MKSVQGYVDEMAEEPLIFLACIICFIVKNGWMQIVHMEVIKIEDSLLFQLV